MLEDIKCKCDPDYLKDKDSITAMSLFRPCVFKPDICIHETSINIIDEEIVNTVLDYYNSLLTEKEKLELLTYYINRQLSRQAEKYIVYTKIENNEVVDSVNNLPDYVTNPDYPILDTREPILKVNEYMQEEFGDGHLFNINIIEEQTDDPTSDLHYDKVLFRYRNVDSDIFKFSLKVFITETFNPPETDDTEDSEDSGDSEEVVIPAPVDKGNFYVPLISLYDKYIYEIEVDLKNNLVKCKYNTTGEMITTLPTDTYNLTDDEIKFINKTGLSSLFICMDAIRYYDKDNNLVNSILSTPTWKGSDNIKCSYAYNEQMQEVASETVNEDLGPVIVNKHIRGDWYFNGIKILHIFVFINPYTIIKPEPTNNDLNIYKLTEDQTYYENTTFFKTIYDL